MSSQRSSFKHVHALMKGCTIPIQHQLDAMKPIDRVQFLLTTKAGHWASSSGFNELSSSIDDHLAAARETSDSVPETLFSARQNSTLFPGKSAHYGCVCLNDDRVLCVPHSAENIRIFDYRNDTATTSGTFPTPNGLFAGGVLLRNGQCCFVPKNSPNVQLYSPGDNTMLPPVATGIAGSTQFCGGVLLDDNRVLFAPDAQKNIYLYDVRTSKVEKGPPATGYRGSCLLPNGDATLAPWTTDGGVIKFDARSNACVKLAETLPENKFNGCVYVGNNTVFFVPHSGGQAGLVNCSSGEIELVDGFSSVGDAYCGASLLGDCRTIVCAPFGADKVTCFDLVTRKVFDIGTTTGSGGAYAGAASLANGDVFLTPFNAGKATIVSGTGFGSFPLSRIVRTSPYLNTF